MPINAITSLFEWLPTGPAIFVIGFVLLFLLFCSVKLVLGIIKLIVDIFGKLIL